MSLDFDVPHGNPDAVACRHCKARRIRLYKGKLNPWPTLDAALICLTCDAPVPIQLTTTTTTTHTEENP